MIIKYFPETDTLYIVLADRTIAETVDLNDDTLLDLDEAGELVALTLEHAREKVDLTDLSFQQVAQLAAAAD